MEKKESNRQKETTVVSPLRNERIYVRFVPRHNGLAPEDKKHPAYGGLIDGGTVTLCVPMNRNGSLKNVLTNEEKEYLEKALGFDYGALSVYNKENNFWSNYKLVLTKEGLNLDLSNPNDYIKYKVLLANPEIVAPSVQERQERYKASYRFEIVNNTEETSLENEKMDATMASYKEFGKIDSDVDTMRVLVMIMDSRPYDVHTKSDFLRARINALIQANPKEFLRQVTDPLLHTKVIIWRATELGKLSKRGDYYYLKSDGSPLCEGGENPTLSIAAKYLSLPSHQDIKFALESEVDKNRA